MDDAPLARLLRKLFQKLGSTYVTLGCAKHLMFDTLRNVIQFFCTSSKRVVVSPKSFLMLITY